MYFAAKSRGFQLYVRTKVSWGETIDQKELERFGRMRLEGFLEPVQVKKRRADFRGPIGVSLCERLEKPIVGEDFLNICEQASAAMERLQHNRLPLEHLVTDFKYVYFNEVTREIRFVYLPTAGRQARGTPSQLFAAMVYSARPLREEDSEILSEFARFLRETVPFDLRRVRSFAAGAVRGPGTDRETGGWSRRRSYTAWKGEDWDGTGGDERDWDGETGLLAVDQGAEGTYERGADEEGTALLSEQKSLRYPTLFRVLTRETISIDKPVYRIGKEKSYVDYFVKDNPAVSRSHADIITRGGRYYVKDLHSKNHTYINDREAPAHLEREIFDGDLLRLGNEEFVFHV